MGHDQDAAVAAATVADEVWSALLADLLGRVAGCFPRRETRQCCGQMVRGLLMELDDHNCWAIAEAVGHRGPHRLQHLLSRAVWAAGHLDDGDAVLIVDLCRSWNYAEARAGVMRTLLAWASGRVGQAGWVGIVP